MGAESAEPGGCGSRGQSERDEADVNGAADDGDKELSSVDDGAGDGAVAAVADAGGRLSDCETEVAVKREAEAEDRSGRDCDDKEEDEEEGKEERDADARAGAGANDGC
jgi:hypothetical protein